MINTHLDGLGDRVQMGAAQNHNPIPVKMELILLWSSGMVNLHNCFSDVLTVYACRTILEYVIMVENAAPVPQDSER